MRKRREVIGNQVFYFFLLQDQLARCVCVCVCVCVRTRI